MSYTTLTVPGMNEPPSSYDITVRVAKDDSRPHHPAAYASADAQAASTRNASVVSAHTAGEIICLVSVVEPGRPSAVAFALAVVADGLRAQSPVPSLAFPRSIR
jgi:hypothetical protein